MSKHTRIMKNEHGYCPNCNANFDAGSIWEHFFQKTGDEQEATRIADMYGATRERGKFGRRIALYDRDKDRTVAWKCPDCGVGANMTNNITLPRAVAERIRESMQLWVDSLEHDYDIDALAALDAALAEPTAKREPATAAEIVKAGGECAVVDDEYLLDFRDGWHEAERFHGIRKEDT